MNKVILFDIDHTLLDTNNLKKLQLKEVKKTVAVGRKKLNASVKNFIYKLDSPTDFKPEKLAFYLKKNFSVNIQKILNIYYKEKEFYKSSVFKESRIVLEKLSSRNELGIFSEGDIKFQKTKLRFSGLEKYFNPELVYIFRRKTVHSNLKKIPKGTLIIDDKIDIAKRIYRYPNIDSIWINRNSSKRDECVRTVSNLVELLDKSKTS